MNLNYEFCHDHDEMSPDKTSNMTPEEALTTRAPTQAPLLTNNKKKIDFFRIQGPPSSAAPITSAVDTERMFWQEWRIWEGMRPRFMFSRGGPDINGCSKVIVPVFASEQ